MAAVTLYLDRLREKDLPDCCMRCNAPVAVHKSRNFSWHPPWVGVLILAGLLPYVVVAMILTKRARVPIPFCSRHSNHWTWRALVTWLGLLVVLGLGFTSVIFINEIERGGRNNLAGLVCLGSIVLGLIWLITAAVLQSTAIRPEKIDDDEIKLAGVSQDFADALKEHRRELKRQRMERAAAPVADAPPGTIACPYCGEPIKASARRCKHCREDLDEEYDEYD